METAGQHPKTPMLATVNGAGDFLSSVVVGTLWTWAGTTVAFGYCAVLFLAGAWLMLRISVPREQVRLSTPEPQV